MTCPSLEMTPLTMTEEANFVCFTTGTSSRLSRDFHALQMSMAMVLMKPSQGIPFAGPFPA